MASTPFSRMGPPPRSLAADAQHCIMGLGALDPTEYKAAARSIVPDTRAPLLPSSRHAQRAVVLEAIKAKPLRGGRSRGQPMAASARDGFCKLRSGRGKACGPIELV